MQVRTMKMFDFPGTMIAREFTDILQKLELADGRQTTKMTDEIINVMTINMRDE